MPHRFPYPPLNLLSFRQLISTTLTPMGLNSPAAESLLLGTCAQESLFGQFRHQYKGPAHGIMQIEEGTFDWLVGKYSAKWEGLKAYSYEDLLLNDAASIAIARLKYYSIHSPLPAANDLPGQAAYWNKYYNCNPKCGTDEEFIAHYHLYITHPCAGKAEKNHDF